MPSKYYLHNAAAPYTPATIRGAWDQTAGAVTKALDASLKGGGVNTSIGLAETSATNPFNVLLGRWVSGPLAAQTITGTLNVVLGILESAAAADMNWHLHVYVTQGDSDTPRGTLITDYTESLGVNEWPATATFKALNGAAAISSLAISAGDRVVVEIGYVSREAAATSRTGTLRYGTLNSTLTELADGVAAGTDVTAKAGFLTFSNSLTEDTVSVRLSQAAVEVLTDAPATADVRLSQVVIEVLSSNIPLVDDPTGGGTVPTGTNPAADVSLCGEASPIVWIVVQTDVGERTYAKVDFGLDTVFRSGRLISIDATVRALSDTEGRVETATTTITLGDPDGELRNLAESGTLLNKRIDVYVASLRQIRLGLVARRASSLIVRDFDSTADLQFTFSCEDYFGSFVGELKAETKIPQRTFGTFDAQDDFPFLPTDLIGKAIPIIYGLQSDEATGAPTGITPCLFVGPRRLSDGTDWDEYVICGHAITQVQSWFASDLGTNPIRTKMAPSTEGTEFLIPGFANWIAIVGAASYVVYNGNRYTPIYAKGARSDAAKATASTPIPLAVNIGGIEDVGDGTGTMIDSLPLIIQHFIANFVLLNYRDGVWPAIPSVNGYSRLDTASFAAATATSILRVGGSGYIGAPYIGEGGAQQKAVDAISQLAQDCDLDLGTNRHGQITASMVYNLTAPVRAFTAVTDIVKGTFKPKRRMELLANASLFRYRRRLMSLSATNGPLGSFASDWLVEGQWFADAGSIAAHGGEPAGKRTREQSLYSVRDTTTADNVVSSIQARRYYGPIYAKFQTTLCGLDVDLGDNITVTHFAGLAGVGWTEKLLRVERIAFNPDTLTVDLEGQVI